MTNVPECQLAREAEIRYCTISMVTNFSTGMTNQPLTHAEVVACMKENQCFSVKSLPVWQTPMIRIRIVPATTRDRPSEDSIYDR